MRGLEGKVAVVTGGAQGMGQAIAQRLSEEGCKVWIFDLKIDGEQTAAAIQTESGNLVHYVRVNISQESEIEAAFLQVAEKSGHVDILVNTRLNLFLRGLKLQRRSGKRFWMSTL